MDNGEVECWGWNFYRQLGNGTFDDSAMPVRVLTISDAVDVR